MDQYKKRRVRNMAIMGAISGFIVSVVLYFVVTPSNPAYFMFTVFGGLLGGAQGYLAE